MTILENPKHEVFAQEIVKGNNKAQAARNAGFSHKTAAQAGNRLCKDPQIAARIKELSEQSTKLAVATVGIDKSWVLNKLVVIADRCTLPATWSPAGANKALELIGKELGMYGDTITREHFELLMHFMGLSVARHVTDSLILERITSEWSKITVTDPRKLKAAGQEDEQPAGSDPDVTVTPVE